MVTKTETRRNDARNEDAPITPFAPQTQPLFAGLPGAVGFAPLAYGQVQQGFAPQGFALVQPASIGAPWPNLGLLPNLPQAQAFGPPGIAPQQQASIPVALQDLGREIVATFEVPGIAASDLQVTVANTTVTLRAQKPAVNGRVYHGVFALPADVLPSQASARLENGLLVLNLPRRVPTEEPRRVEVEG